MHVAEDEVSLGGRKSTLGGAWAAKPSAAARAKPPKRVRGEGVDAQLDIAKVTILARQEPIPEVSMTTIIPSSIPCVVAARQRATVRNFQAAGPRKSAGTALSSIPERRSPNVTKRWTHYTRSCSAQWPWR